MKAVDDSKVAEKQFLIRFPGNCAELYGPSRNATRRMCFVGSSVGLRSTSVTRLESATACRQVAAADGARHTLPAPRRYSSSPIPWRSRTPGGFTCSSSCPMSPPNYVTAISKAPNIVPPTNSLIDSAYRCSTADCPYTTPCAEPATELYFVFNKSLF